MYYGNLVAEMKKAKITQTDLAKHLGITKNSINKKLQGKFSWKRDEMFMIKKIFPECTIEYLFTVN